MAICIDCQGKIQHIKPIVYGYDFDFDVYIDRNGDFKRSMSVTGAPYTILFDNKMNPVCRHTGFCNGDELLICEKIDQCLAGQNGKTEDIRDSANLFNGGILP